MVLKIESMWTNLKSSPRHLFVSLGPLNLVGFCLGSNFGIDLPRFERVWQLELLVFDCTMNTSRFAKKPWWLRRNRRTLVMELQRARVFRVLPRSRSPKPLSLSRSISHLPNRCYYKVKRASLPISYRLRGALCERTRVSGRAHSDVVLVLGEVNGRQKGSVCGVRHGVAGRGRVICRLSWECLAERGVVGV